MNCHEHTWRRSISLGFGQRPTSGVKICRRCGMRLDVEMTDAFRAELQLHMAWVFEMEAVLAGYLGSYPVHFNCRCLPKPGGCADNR